MYRPRPGIGSDQSIMSMPRPPQGIRWPLGSTRKKAIEKAVMGCSPTFLTLTWMPALSATSGMLWIFADTILESPPGAAATQASPTKATSRANRTRFGAIDHRILEAQIRDNGAPLAGYFPTTRIENESGNIGPRAG